MVAALDGLWVKRPLFVLAAGSVAMLGLDAWRSDLVWVGIIGFALAVWLMRNWRSALVAVILTASLVASTRWHNSCQAADEARFGALGLMEIEARLLEDAVGSEGVWSANAELRGDGMAGKKIRWTGSGEPPPAGTELRAAGVFRPLSAERNPGTLDRRERMRSEGVVAVFQASEMRGSMWIGAFSKRAAAIKQGFRGAIIDGLDEGGLPAKLILAVVLGERSPDSMELVKSFRDSGTLHVFSVSGMHVAMMAMMMWFVLKWVGVPRRLAVPILIAAMFGYVWLAGNGPAALRSAWMGGMFLFAFVLRRRTDLLNVLGAVLLMSLLWDPRMIRMPGVQLSYGVVAAIGIGTMLARRGFEWIAVEETFLPKSEMVWWQRGWLRLRQKIATGLAVSLAASVGSTPLTIFHFGIVTPISVIATVALVPFIYFVLGAALVSALIHPVSRTASMGLNRVNAHAANVCAGAAEFFSEIPGAWAQTSFPHEECLVIYDLDYGAAAACFASTTRNAVMIDSGGDFNMEPEVGPSLRQLGINPDSVIFTHADSGHVAGAKLMREMFPIRQVALGADKITSDWDALPAGQVHVLKPRGGEFIDFGNGARAEVLLSPHDEMIGPLADDRVLILMLHWRGWKILWLGDSGRLSDLALLESGADLKADVIIAGSHETDVSLTDPLIAAIAPQVLILPRPPGGEVDSYRESQRKKWERRDFLIIDQKATGGLTVTISQNGDMRFSGYLDGSEVKIERR